MAYHILKLYHLVTDAARSHHLLLNDMFLMNVLNKWYAATKQEKC